MAVKVTYSTSGAFFRNPVGKLHQNVYDVLQEAADVGANAARDQLQPGHGYLTGNLYDSIQPRLVKATRSGVRFGGRARVVTGSRGFEPVRFYAGKVERKYRYMAGAAKQVRSWADSNRGRISAALARGLS